MRERLIGQSGKARPMRWIMSVYLPYFDVGNPMAQIGKTLYVRLEPPARQV